MVDSVSSGSTIAGSGDSALSTLNQNFDQFLTLLTTQLKNQDPMDPVDTNEFTNQLVQFASVEQLIKQNEYFEELISQQNIATSVAAADFAGKLVEVPGNVATLKDGEARWAYYLQDDADEVQINIVDKEGFVMQSFQGEGGAGIHEITWDGEDTEGDQAEDGNYYVQIKAFDQEGQQLYTTMWGHGQVEGVEIGGSAEPYLLVDGTRHAISLVSEIS